MHNFCTPAVSPGAQAPEMRFLISHRLYVKITFLGHFFGKNNFGNLKITFSTIKIEKITENLILAYT